MTLEKFKITVCTWQSVYGGSVYSHKPRRKHIESANAEYSTSNLTNVNTITGATCRGLSRPNIEALHYCPSLANMAVERCLFDESRKPAWVFFAAQKYLGIFRPQNKPNRSCK